jgi:hypothetical protein
LLTKYFSGDKTEKNEMCGTCSASGGEEKSTQGFWWGNLRERVHLGDPGADWSIILKWFFRKWDGGVDWIDLVQDSDRWRALMNAVMSLWAP